MLVDDLTALVDMVTPLIDPETIGEEAATEISAQIKKVQDGLAALSLMGNAPRKEITSFDDWDEMVYGQVEFVRPDGSIEFMKIHSISAAERKRLRNKRNKLMPIAPSPRSRGDGQVDTNDPHYKMEMKEYEAAVTRLDELNVLWTIEAGTDLVVPGETDEEKLANLDRHAAGDQVKIANEIVDVSGLTPDSLRPFMRR